MTIYRGVGGVNREITSILRGVNGVNRELSQMFRGVSGVNREVFTLGTVMFGSGGQKYPVVSSPSFNSNYPNRIAPIYDGSNVNLQVPQNNGYCVSMFTYNDIINFANVSYIDVEYEAILAPTSSDNYPRIILSANASNVMTSNIKVLDIGASSRIKVTYDIRDVTQSAYLSFANPVYAATAVTSSVKIYKIILRK